MPLIAAPSATISRSPAVRRRGGANPGSVPIPERLWVPTDLGANLIAWYDASNAASIIQSGGAVSQWSDLSGNGHHLTQATGANQPTYAANAVTFAHVSNQYLVGSVATFYDFFVVGTPNAAGSFRTLLRATGVGNHQYVIDTGSNALCISDTGIKYAGSLTWPAVFGQGYLTFPSGTSASMSRDGGTVTAIASVSMGITSPGEFGNSSGGSQGWGAVNQMIFGVAGLSASDRQKVEGYNAWKWDGINGNTAGVTALPGGHPHKAAAPTIAA